MEGKALGEGAVKRGEGEEEEEEEEEEESDEGEAATGAEWLYERKASGGLGAALGIARNRGLLAAAEEKAGRMFDQKGAGLHAYDDAGGEEAGAKGPSFTLDHFDEYGRAMTAKQAFRQMSWKFHGKAPSKKNREKRLLEAEKQLAEKKEDKAMACMHALQAAQQSTKSAHVVMTGLHALKPTDIKPARREGGEGGGGEPKKKKAKAGI